MFYQLKSFVLILLTCFEKIKFKERPKKTKNLKSIIYELLNNKGTKPMQNQTDIKFVISSRFIFIKTK